MSLVAGPPNSAVRLPAGLEFVVANRPWLPVWRNELGGVTVQIGTGVGREFLKWAPVDNEIDLDGEARRLRWAGRYTAVPTVLDLGRTDDVQWLLTAGLPGDNAIAARWLTSPATAVVAIATGLRALHDALPVGECPFSWPLEDRIAAARRRLADGIGVDTWHPIHQHLTAAAALRLLEDPPTADKIVVCHGDACAPNTLLDDAGIVTGHVDLGRLGVADRWADLAVATWSAEWNFGPGWDRAMLDAYGIEPDADRMAYYRLLWDAS